MSAMPDKSFDEESFHFGREGERAYMAFSLGKGRMMVEVGALREKLGEGAPMIYLPEMYLGKDKLISPDFLTINAQARLSGTPCPWIDKNFVWTSENMWDHPFLWNEVKSKNGCTFSLALQCWQTGIDGYQLRHYLMVQHKTRIPLLLFFLQIGTKTAQKVLPLGAGPCPTGIYACPVSQLPDTTWPWNSSVKTARMAYWNIDKLIHLGSVEELLPVNKISRHVNLNPSSEEGRARASTRNYFNPPKGES